jgi:hypothetical protein
MLGKADEAEVLSKYRWLNEKLLLALDGVHYFSSQKIHCEKCNKKQQKDGCITYNHSMVSATLVHPNKGQVLPLPPEFIEPQDGEAKQDCELKAAKRWLTMHGKKYADMNIVILGDDLYSRQPFCESAINTGYDFIFVCKPDSHKALYENLEGLKKLEAIETRIIKRNKESWCCRYINQVAMKDGDDALDVNWCELRVLNREGKQIYYNTFITNQQITRQNVLDIVIAGRTRWKTENELNNTLKNHGYFLEHNYGHGKKHLAELLVNVSYG